MASQGININIARHKNKEVRPGTGGSFFIVMKKGKEPRSQDMSSVSSARNIRWRKREDISTNFLVSSFYNLGRQIFNVKSGQDERRDTEKLVHAPVDPGPSFQMKPWPDMSFIFLFLYLRPRFQERRQGPLS